MLISNHNFNLQVKKNNGNISLDLWFSINNSFTYSVLRHWLCSHQRKLTQHYDDVIMSAIASHQPHDCLPNRLFKAQIKENIKAPRHRPLCGEFIADRWIPAQMASNAENVSIWWRHHEMSSGYLDTSLARSCEFICHNHRSESDPRVAFQLNKEYRLPLWLT